MRANQVKGSNKHHLWHPASDYNTPLERKFRGLRCQQVEIDYFAHHLHHQQLQIFALPKPSTEDMEKAIIRHKRNHCACH